LDYAERNEQLPILKWLEANGYPGDEVDKEI
jgi:hypothetical protein